MWCSLTGSNRRLPTCKDGTLPTELKEHKRGGRMIVAVRPARIGWIKEPTLLGTQGGT